MQEKKQPSICVITPTIGRPELYRAFKSGKGLQTLDRWVVMVDGPPKSDVVQTLLWTEVTFRTTFHQFTDNQGDYGNALRDLAIKGAYEDYLIFLDDDDEFAPGAIEIIKTEIKEHYPRPIIFKMVNGNGETLWTRREVTPGNVGGSMFCCPNNKERLGKWSNGAGHRSDFEFIAQTLELYGPAWRQNIYWSDKVIIHCRPELWRAKNE